ncbi:MAG: hypothetical protein EB011_02255 [Actinobacteria bacterium]|nr:hypothetical protein [Actinomycetota bacterium]
MVKLQDLVELFIASNKLNNDFDEILRLVCVKLLVGFDIESVIFCALEKNGSIRPNSYFGIDAHSPGDDKNLCKAEMFWSSRGNTYISRFTTDERSPVVEKEPRSSVMSMITPLDKSRP